MPTSGTPVSDAIIDTFKMVKNPPSRAQLESKEMPKAGWPQSGTPMTDKIIDTFKMIQDPPSRAQVDKKDSTKSGTPTTAAPTDLSKKVTNSASES